MSDELMKIRGYYYWDLYLHRKQVPHIGRCYARSKRAELVHAMGIDTLEHNELFSNVLPDWSRIAKGLFKYDRPDVLIKGNGDPHLYVHIIPRYNTPRKAFGMSFNDPRPNDTHNSHVQRELPMDLLKIIRDAMIDRIADQKK